MSDKLKIVPGFATCPACSVLGTPQEERQGLKTGCGRVYCMACGLVTSEFTDWSHRNTLADLPAFARDAVLALVTSRVETKTSEADQTYRVISCRKGGIGASITPTASDYTERASAAVAQGMVAAMIEEADDVQVRLVFGPYAFHSVEFTFKPSRRDVEVADEPAVDDLTKRYASLTSRLPEPTRRAVVELLKLGFEPGKATLDQSICHVSLGKTSARGAVKAEFSWIN